MMEGSKENSSETKGESNTDVKREIQRQWFQVFIHSKEKWTATYQNEVYVTLSSAFNVFVFQREKSKKNEWCIRAVGQTIKKKRNKQIFGNSPQRSRNKHNFVFSCFNERKKCLRSILLQQRQQSRGSLVPICLCE